MSVTCSEAESLVPWLREGDVDLTLTQSKFQRAQIISKPGEHQQSCVVPRTELELHCQAALSKEPWHLEIVVGPRKGHGSPKKVTACVVHLFLWWDEPNKGVATQYALQNYSLVFMLPVWNGNFLK